MIVIKELELKQFLKLFWDKKFFIVIVMIIFAIMGGVKVKYFTTPVYEASGKLICARSEESISEGTTVTSTELTMPSSLAETYAELIKSNLVVSQVIENLNLDMSVADLTSSVELTPVTKVYYQVSVRSTDREKSAQIANEFIKVFSEEVKKFYEIDNIHVVDEAKAPMVAINMNMGKNIKIFAGIGFVVAAATVLIMFIFNNTVTNSEQIKRYTKLTTLASIPKYSGDEDLITLKDSKSPYAESVKILRTNLQYMYEKGKLQTVGITSSLPGEGKSWLTANLGVAFANSGKKTLIIDADMRRGRQYKVFKVRKNPGLAEYLKADRETMGMVAIKGKRIAKKGLAKFLSNVNRYIKIEKIPAIADIIYKDEYITMTIEDNARTKALKQESNVEQMEIVPEETAKKTTRKRTTKKAVEEVVEEAKPAKRGRKPSAKKAEEVEEKATTKKTTKKVAEEVAEEAKPAKRGRKPATKKVAEEAKPATKSRKTAVKKVEEPEKPAKVELKINDFIRETGIDNLYVLPAGMETMDSSELLASERLQNVLEELKEEFDMILVDTPPVSVVADGFIVSRMVDTNMIVLKHGNTEINELNKIKNNIQEIGGDVIGTVINKTPDANKKYYHTYYNRKVN